MKKVLFFTLLIGSVSAYPLISFNGEWLGTAGYFGPYSAFHSPQNLASKYNPSFVLMIPYLHTGIENNLLSLGLYNELAPMDTITDEFKNRVLNKIGDAYTLSGYFSVTPLGLSIGPVAIVSRSVQAAKVEVPSDLFRIALYGTELNRTYDFTAFRGEAIFYQQNTVGFAWKQEIAKRKVHFGLAGSYIMGLAYLDFHSTTGRIHVGSEGVEVADTVTLRFSVPNYVFNIGDSTWAPKFSDLVTPAGTGYSFTVGTSVEITPKFILGLTLENLISSISWNSDSTMVGKAAISSTNFDLEDLFSAESLKQIFSDTFEMQRSSFRTSLPTLLRISGRYDFYRLPFRFYFDLEQGFKNTALSSTRPRLSLAFEANTFIPLLVGTSFGGGAKPILSLGSGFQLPFFFINAGVSTRGFTVEDWEGAHFTFAMGFRSVIYQYVEGTIYDSTTGTPLIANVEVIRSDGKKVVPKVKEKGYFKVKLPWGKTRIRIFAQDYASIDTVIFVDKKEKKSLQFYLMPLYGEVIALVTDFVTGLPKQYVPVIIERPDGKVDTLLTDESGKVTKKYLQGVYTLKILEANYKPVIETFEIKPLETVTKNYSIVPTEGEVYGKVMDAKTLAPLVSQIEIYDSTGNLVMTLNTSESGEFFTRLKEGVYRIKVFSEKYIPYEGSFVIEGGKKTTKDISLLKKKMVFTFRNIYFEFNKADIKPESYPVLDSIALFLKEYPNVKVEIGGHTDSRGSDAYNLKLSQARAEAVREYLIKVHNISPERLIAKGYGERRLVVYPEKSEEDYQMNRRVEFTILGEIE
ncbi:MAG: DUF5723 family protein [Candidatus Hydrothermia bacterium]